jgi:hypothetical protein
MVFAVFALLACATLAALVLWRTAPASDSQHVPLTQDQEQGQDQDVEHAFERGATALDKTQASGEEHANADEEPEQAPAARAAAAADAAKDVTRTPALRAAFARESPDATAPAAEARIRAIYGAERDASIIFRDVRCTRSVCKAELRWSPELSEPYNKALVSALQEFSRDIDLTPDVTLGGPEMPIPMTLYIARPGYSVESLVAEQAAQLELDHGAR